MKLYNQKQTADLLGISLSTLYRITKVKKIKATIINARVLYAEEEIQRFIKANTI